MQTTLMRFAGAVRRDPAVEAWLAAQTGDLGTLARAWFERLRACGDEVRELMHDGQATACVGDAAFAYVAVYTAHVNVGFFRGAQLADPAGILEGSGKQMRHVKLKPGRDFDGPFLAKLVARAYADMRERVRAEGAFGQVNAE
jgi:hypothetical protein